MSIGKQNQALYEEAAVAEHYASVSALQPAERTLFALLEGRLASAELLDLGVGGGRTTAHLAPRVRRYVGLDYSPAMLDAARRRFAGRDYELVLGDARALAFGDATFDVALFSHNGLDYVDHDDRLRVLAEVRRVLRPGGLFVFSTHNLARDELFAAPPGEGHLRRALRAPQRARARALNPGHEAKCAGPHAVLNDGAFGFRAATYHIRADAQEAQLREAGFDAIRTFSGASGRELEGPAVAAARDPWLYFLCSATVVGGPREVEY